MADEIARFVAKVSTVKTRKNLDYFVFRMNIPKEIGEKLTLINGDYLVLNARKAKWYDLLDWDQMPKTFEMMPQSLRDEVSQNCLAVNASVTNPIRVNIVLSAAVSVQGQSFGTQLVPIAPTIVFEQPEQTQPTGVPIPVANGR